MTYPVIDTPPPEHEAHYYKPWLFAQQFWLGNGKGYYGCTVCMIEAYKKKRNTAARFLKAHRRCGLVGEK